MKINRTISTVLPLLFLFSGWMTSCDQQDVVMGEAETAYGPVAQTDTGVSSDDAKDVAALFSAKQFGTAQNSRGLGDNQSVSVVRNNGGDPLAYIVNTDGGGWVIVSATKTYHPILAYSDNADTKFDINSVVINDGVAMWLDDVKQDIAQSEALDSVTASQILLEWEEYLSASTASSGSGLPTGNSPEAIKCRERLKYLNETHYREGWHFYTLPNVRYIDVPPSVYAFADEVGSPYEYTIMGVQVKNETTSVGPLLTTIWHQKSPFNAFCPNGYPAGCAAIAMAQIMKYHQHPNAFDWADIKDYEATYASQKLIAEVGKTINTKYEPESSPARIENVCKGFKSYGYEASLKDHNDREVIVEIGTYTRPVYMTGFSSGIGHAWVCDGIDQRSTSYRYYVEYLTDNNEYSNYGRIEFEFPEYYGGSGSTTYHMNWGADYYYDPPSYPRLNGWYVKPNPKPDRDYSTKRRNIYVNPQ